MRDYVRVAKERVPDRLARKHDPYLLELAECENVKVSEPNKRLLMAGKPPLPNYNPLPRRRNRNRRPRGGVFRADFE